MDAVRIARGIGAGAAMIALLAAAMMVVAQHEGDYDTVNAPISATGTVGQQVDAGPFAVRVDKVQVATSIVQKDYGPKGPAIATSGIFLIVTARQRVATDAKELPVVHVTDSDEHRYTVATKGLNLKTLADEPAQPGYWTTGQYLFEMPRTALPGSRMQVAAAQKRDVPQRAYPHWGFEMRPQVDVDLGIDDAKAKRLLSDARAKVPYGGDT